MLERSLPHPGVAAWGARLPDHTVANQCYSDWFGPAQIEQALTRLVLAAESLKAHRLEPVRLCWVFEHARILLARADIADRRLVDALVARGAEVDQFTAYRTVVSGEDAAGLRDAFRSGAIDVVTFASSSTVRNLCSALGDNAGTLLAGSTIACIGPVTAETAVTHGLTPTVVASEHTIAGLVAAIEEYLGHEY